MFDTVLDQILLVENIGVFVFNSQMFAAYQNVLVVVL